MSKICFLIPDGVGIRNYLYSDLFKLLNESGHEVVIWHALAQEVVTLSTEINGFAPQQKELKVFNEDFLVQILKESTTYARLKYNIGLTGNPTIMQNWHDKMGSTKRKILIRLAEFFGKQIKDYKGIEGTEKLYFSQLRKTAAYTQYRADLKEMNPDLLFCTHQRYPGAAYALEAAKDLGITTATAIFSWDNLPKARLLVRSDFYTVWSDYMKEELMFYYPEISEDQVEITGTPQFDFYKNIAAIKSREEFAEEFGLNASKSWVCFSGSDSKTSPYDAAYLEDVAAALQNESGVQLIFRQVPVEGVERYADVLKKYPNIKNLNPIWHKGEFWNQFYPYPEDITHLVNLSFHCATVVNIGSTMALDFSWFDSPGLYLNYDHTGNQEWRTEDIYNFQHFRSMGDWDAVAWANSPGEIRERILQIIDSPDKLAKDRRLWLKKIVGQLEGPSSATRISEFLTHKLNLKPTSKV
ncbi:glycosyltransferase family protein [Algoriphagus chordae]|uniref:Monogalactosyldiacylglycerol (MGDG) synthase n=1 Tax=Algoriphagus chordae TaxID=237019 RepID=A0A2W7QGM9_9BACT|nr:hypothetical protein [Algoriphagus chordae]PZX47678.1 hypothetical protein LV85_03868 [Algoriphagus chordae]